MAFEDLVDTVRPGDRIEITGEKEMKGVGGEGRRGEGRAGEGTEVG